MPQTDVAGALAALEGLINVERHSIRNGEFDDLESLAIEKARLLEAIIATREAPVREDLARLKAKADANQRILAAALKGVRAAQKRLDMIRRASRSLNVYDRMGRAQSIGGNDGTVERRA